MGSPDWRASCRLDDTPSFLFNFFRFISSSCIWTLRRDVPASIESSQWHDIMWGLIPMDRRGFISIQNDRVETPWKCSCMRNQGFNEVFAITQFNTLMAVKCFAACGVLMNFFVF